MTVIVYKSTDSSAPVLYGAADSLNALLKACLVDGYGSKAAAGWTSPYYDSATKTRVFLTGGGNTAYLRVLDNGQSAGGAKEARIIGYESMSAHDTGTGLFPTAAQRTNGFTIRKSSLADGTTARAWYLFATDSLFHLLIESGDTAGACSFASFGKIKSYKASDTFGFWIAGRAVENSGVVSTANDPGMDRGQLGTLSTSYAVYLMRSYTGAGASVVANCSGDVSRVSSSVVIAGSTGLTYPHQVDGGLYLNRTTLFEQATPCLRGEVPGLWYPAHSQPLPHLDTVSGTGGISSKSFLALKVGSIGEVMLETSDTWDV